MARCNTPDTLIGVGEGGSRTVYRFMQQRWILDEVLADRQLSGGGSGPDSLQAVTIDSATKDNWHGDKYQAAKEVIDNAIEDSNYSEGRKLLQIHEPTIIPSELSKNWTDGTNLTSNPAVKKLHDRVGLNSWWMEKGREPLTKIDSKGFDGGVFKRRSTSKALFHIAQSEEKLDLPNDIGEEVCIVAALGGGTGSGMAIDLAKEIDANKVHLFGIIPNLRENSQFRTNAFAALSELEYAQITGETPFHSVTLMPYIEDISHNDEVFEKSVVKTILAHQNGFQGDNALERVASSFEDPTHSAGYAPFVFAVPDTVKYDFKAVEEAKSLVDDQLRNKIEELKYESDFYEAVGEYLKTSFENVNRNPVGKSETVEFSSERGIKEANSLRSRLEEDVLTKFLEQPTLKTAGLDELVEEMKEVRDRILEEDRLYNSSDSPREQTNKFLSKVPDQLIGEFKDERDPESKPPEESSHKFLKALKLEIENIRDRRNVWAAISQISTGSSQGDDVELRDTEAELLRAGLFDVVMDPDQRYLSSIMGDTSVGEKIEDLESERQEIDNRLDRIENLRDEVTSDLLYNRDQWYEAALEDLVKLAAIKRNSKVVDEAISDLREHIERQVDAVVDASADYVGDINLNLKSVGTLGEGEYTVDGIGPLNNKLRSMGVEEIKVNDIKRDFEKLKECKRLHDNHGKGLIKPNDNTEPFSEEAGKAESNGFFEINPNSPNYDVDEEFRAKLKSDSINRSDKIESVKENSINGVTSSFKDHFVEHGQLITYTTDLKESDIQDLPQGITVGSVVQNLRSSIEASAETDADDLSNDILPSEVFSVGDDSSEFSSEDSQWDTSGSNRVSKTLDSDGHRGAALSLRDAYISPLESTYNTLNERLQTIVQEDNGLIYKFKKLKGMAEGPNSVDEVEIPDTTPIGGRDQKYGNDYVEFFDGIYEFEVDERVETNENNNPYVNYEETDPSSEPFVKDPDHIGEIDVSEQDAVINGFINSTKQMLDRDHQRLPLNETFLQAAGNETDAKFNELRVRQVYMSRTYEGNTDVQNVLYDEVHEQYKDRIPGYEDPDVYKSEVYPYGWDDDVTKVTFVGGIILDNIRNVTASSVGYKETYEANYNPTEFNGAHHSIGLGGMWDNWPTMGGWAEERGPEHIADEDYGAYVYRNETRDIAPEFIEEIKLAAKEGDESVKNLFLDMMGIDVYESTEQIN